MHERRKPVDIIVFVQTLPTRIVTVACVMNIVSLQVAIFSSIGMHVLPASVISGVCETKTD